MNIEELQARLDAEMRALEAEKAQRRAEERARAESRSNALAYVQKRALEQIDRGRPNPKVIATYLESLPHGEHVGDRKRAEVQAVLTLATHPFSGVKFKGKGTSFNGQDYASLSLLKEGLKQAIGGATVATSDRWLDVLIEDLAHGGELDWLKYLKLITEPDPRQLEPEGVSHEDYVWLSSLGLVNWMN